jgi:hypothetical protein
MGRIHVHFYCIYYVKYWICTMPVYGQSIGTYSKALDWRYVFTNIHL